MPRAKPTTRTEEEPTLRMSAAQWHAWLAANHASVPAALVLITKQGAPPPHLSYPEALEAALIWGWIDGHKRGRDAHVWIQRFTPRRSRSIWSKINCDKAEALIRAGKMQPAGLAEVERAKQDGRWAAAYDSPRTSQPPEDLVAALATNRAARASFAEIDATNRYAILHRIQTAKKPETRASRIATFVAMLARGELLHPARRARPATRRSAAAPAPAAKPAPARSPGRKAKRPAR